MGDTVWEYQGFVQRVRGLVQGDYELVKERNGPFAGKKINRPVANYAKCHKACSELLEDRLNIEDSSPLKALFKYYKNLKNRPVYMKGLLLEKCFERGLSLPFRGGNVRMKTFSESLKHACKVPNTEQPFACTDMMYIATLLDKIFGFRQGSILYSPRNMRGGKTGDWPLAASFYIYQNGL